MGLRLEFYLVLVLRNRIRIQISQRPPVNIVRAKSSRRWPKPYFLVLVRDIVFPFGRGLIRSLVFYARKT